MPPYPNFVGGSGRTQSLISDVEQTMNWYVERSQSPGAVSQDALYPTPGFSAFVPSMLRDTGGRAACNAGGRPFVLMGAGLYEVFANGTAIQRGDVAQDSHLGQLVYNGVVANQLGIASGGNFYCYDLASNVLTLELTGEATMIAYADGYFLAFNSTTGKVRLSGLNDGTSWDPGTFVQRSKFADPWQTMFVDPNNLVWLIGTETFEVWYDTGSGTQPFAPLAGLSGKYGIVAPWAFGVSSLGTFWLARTSEGTGQFVVTRGSVPQPVSSYAVNTAVERYLETSRIDDAEVLLYQQYGHTFANVAFPSVPATWTYDIEGQSWTQRGKWNSSLGRWDIWTPRVHCQAFGKHLTADRTTGVIAQMSVNTGTELDGTGIVRERIAPGLTQEHARIPIDQLELLMDVGEATQTGQGSDPQMLLQVSVDGGRTFGNERRAGFGRIGEYRRRVIWQQLGAPAHMVPKLRVSDPIPTRILAAWVNNIERAA